MAKMERSGVLTAIHYTNQLDPLDQKNLDTLFEMLANKSYVSLLLNRSKLEKLHHQLEHVHPLNFLETTKIQSNLRKNVKQLASNGDFVWKVFKKHFIEQMSDLNQQGGIKPYIDDFADKAELNRSQVREYVAKDDMQDLLYYAIRS